MKRNYGMLFAFMGVLLVAQLGHANEIDTALARAKKEGKAVMLELGSVGCKQCKKMKPVMKKLRTDYTETLEVMFIDVKKDRRAAERFDVFGIPTQVFLDKEGKEFHRHYGFYSFEEITMMLKKAGL
jgi:thioredoxin 1